MKDKSRDRALWHSTGSVLRLFFTTSLRNQALVLLCLLTAGAAEGIGIAGMLQILNLASGTADERSPLNRLMLEILNTVGLHPTLPTLLILVGVGTWLRGGMLLAAGQVVGVMVANFSTQLRLNLIDALLEARWSYFSRHPIGRYANAISVEAQRAAEAYLSIATCITFAIQAIIYMVIALAMSWQLFLVAIVMGSVILLTVGSLVHMSRRAGRRQTERTQVLVSRLSDVLAGIKPLKAMGQEQQLKDYFRGSAMKLNRALRRQVLSRGTNQNLKEPILVSLMAIAFYFAADQAGASLTGFLVMAFVLVRTVSMFGKAQERYQEAVSAESAYWSLRSLIDEAADHKEIAEGTLKPDFERACVFETVSFAHDERTVLDAVSLRVETGVVTVLTGISGAGKTTIVDLLAGLLKPASGRILVDDRLLAELDLPAWRRMIGYVPQEVRLFNDTILANVTLERPGTTREEAIEALKEAHAWRFIAPLPNGVDSEVGERGSLFSGGERQRIALARALLGRPRLLILDEATSALDGEAEIELCRALADLCHRHGFAILAIAHRPAWLRVADRVYTLAGGKLKEQTAPPRELAS